MELKLNGKIIKGVGGIYEVRLPSADAEMLGGEGVKICGDTLLCKARGVFRHENLTLLVGDDVVLRVDTDLAKASDSESKGQRRTDEAMGGVMIEEADPRKNQLIRPPVANIDIIFAVVAVSKPAPVLSAVDKLITIAEHKNIEPVVVITKADLDPDGALRFADIYKRCGFSVFVEGVGIDGGELEEYIRSNANRVSVFAGASGVGKSTLMNRLFPSLGLTTGEISQKTQRGRHTTRHVELYPLDRQFGGSAAGYVADTPGFSMLDFLQFDFYTKEDLPYVFREFEPYIGGCRFSGCAHYKEPNCAVRTAVERGEIAPSRYESYVTMYEAVKDKKEWEKP